MTIDVVCPETGEVRSAQLFVAALGASSYTYVEASWSQKLPDWIASHTRAFAFFGGVPAQVVPDNLKAGVTKACFYDPAINRTYADMAAHYDTAVVPARPRKPKDKAKVEAAVLLAERWIVARLRNRRFFGLDELNAAIRPPPRTLKQGAGKNGIFIAARRKRPAGQPRLACPQQVCRHRRLAQLQPVRNGPDRKTLLIGQSQYGSYIPHGHSSRLLAPWHPSLRPLRKPEGCRGVARKDQR